MKLSYKQISVLKKNGIKLVYLFGSRAEDKDMQYSDTDIGILLDYKTGRKTDLTEVYNQLYDLFTDIFPKKDIDLVILNRSTLELRFDVINHGQILYSESADDKLDFEEKTMISYADFKPILEEFNKAVINRDN